LKANFNFINGFSIRQKTLSIICLCVSVLSRVANVLYFSNVVGDKITTGLMSRSFLRGYGLSIQQYFVSNPDFPIYNTAPLWPPGYPLVLAGFLKLFNNDLYWATTAMDLIAAIALIFIVRSFCIIIGFTQTGVNLATLTVGCFDYYFINASQPTDLVTITLLFLGYYFIIKALINNSVNVSLLVIASFFLVLPTFFRYAYHLSIVILLVCILITGYALKNKGIIKKGRILFVSSVSFYLFLALTQLLISGALFYNVPTQKGAFFNNLWPWASFIPSSFISLNFLYTKIFSGILSFYAFEKLSEIVNFFGMVVIAGLFVFLLLKYKAFKTITPFRWFVLTGVSISAGILFLLVYVSFTNKEQIYHGVSWNYLREPRYFGFITILIQLAFIGWCFSDKQLPFKHPLLIVIKYVLAFLIFVELIHNIYFNARLPYTYKRYKQEHHWQTRFMFIEASIKSIIDKNRGKDILVASFTHPVAPYIASYYGQKGLADIQTLNLFLPQVNKPSLLIVHLTDDELLLFKPFLAKTHPHLYSKNDYDNIYLIELRP
jgi:hypothetical protein